MSELNLCKSNPRELKAPTASSTLVSLCKIVTDFFTWSSAPGTAELNTPTKYTNIPSHRLSQLFDHSPRGPAESPFSVVRESQIFPDGQIVLIVVT